ncbi:MAG: Ig-like domain-containing protein [Planctomycetes bacterium]|nr:Ig-like domain-containing protein [Planctomycetota bacterium]
MRRSWTWAIAPAVLACAPAPPPAPRVLVHRLTRPEPGALVRLNESLVFHFSADVDRASVTQESVRITARDGRPARGRLVVDGSRVRFDPAPVLAADLSDGGYVPGASYTIEIAGFPRPDGLRAADGAPLASTYRAAFRAVEARGGAEQIFEDRDPDRVRPLRLFPAPQGQPVQYEIGPLDSLYLRCEEPLDPSSLVDGAFALRPRRGPEVPLRPRLLENDPVATLKPRPARVRSSTPASAWEREPRAALVELTPARRLPASSSEPWRLVFRPEVAVVEIALVPFLPGWPALPLAVPRTHSGVPRDLGGHSVWEPALVLVGFPVVDRGRDVGRGAWVEEFLDTRLRSTIAVPGVDGTAAWIDSGRVEVRFPKAAGDGRQGDLELTGVVHGRDHAAVRARVARGVTCRLGEAEGPVVLRTQGMLRIEGRLERTTGARTPLHFEPGRLSDWLDRTLAVAGAAARERDWTILIAGGDLVVDGEIEVSTPLLLVAGGRIRVSGAVRSAQPGQVFRLGEGGGPGLSASTVEGLELDPPEDNPLRETLRFAVLSGPLPARGSVVEWLEAEASGSAPARGRTDPGWSVRYVPELQRAPEALGDLEVVDSPELLRRPGPLQVLIELVVEPGGRWRPPFVDAVRLAWRDPEGGER